MQERNTLHVCPCCLAPQSSDASQNTTVPLVLDKRRRRRPRRKGSGLTNALLLLQQQIAVLNMTHLFSTSKSS